MLDLNSDFGQRVDRRLAEERIIWLTTAGSDGTPQPRPVWFLWDGDSFLIYSRPDTAKLRHIAGNPRVALNLDGDGLGGDIVVFIGEAEILSDGPAADQIEDYMNKYVKGFEQINMSAAQFAEVYSQSIRVRPVQLRGH